MVLPVWSFYSEQFNRSWVKFKDSIFHFSAASIIASQQ